MLSIYGNSCLITSILLPVAPLVQQEGEEGGFGVVMSGLFETRMRYDNDVELT